MRSLGEAMGMSHMAVYHHFPSGREELLGIGGEFKETLAAT